MIKHRHPIFHGPFINRTSTQSIIKHHETSTLHKNGCRMNTNYPQEISRIIDIIGIIGWFSLLPRSSADLPWRPWSYVLGPLLELLVAPRFFGRSRLARSLRQKRNAEMLSCLKVGDTQKCFFFNGENEDSPLEYIGICDSPFSDKPICKTMSQIVTATFDASNFKPNIGPVEKKFRHRGSRPFKPRVGFQPVRGGSLCPPMLLI